MSDGVYTRGGWQPLPENDESLHTGRKVRGLALVWAMVCLVGALLGVVLLRRRKRGRLG